MATQSYQAYLETYNLQTGFTRDEYCFLEIGTDHIKVWLEESHGWDEYQGHKVGAGHFTIWLPRASTSPVGMLHQSPGYDEFEGNIVFEDTPCLIHIELVRGLKENPVGAIGTSGSRTGSDDL